MLCVCMCVHTHLITIKIKEAVNLRQHGNNEIGGRRIVGEW